MTTLAKIEIIDDFAKKMQGIPLRHIQKGCLETVLFRPRESNGLSTRTPGTNDGLESVYLCIGFFHVVAIELGGRKHQFYIKGITAVINIQLQAHALRIRRQVVSGRKTPSRWSQKEAMIPQMIIAVGYGYIEKNATPQFSEVRILILASEPLQKVGQLKITYIIGGIVTINITKQSHCG